MKGFQIRQAKEFDDVWPRWDSRQAKNEPFTILTWWEESMNQGKLTRLALSGLSRGISFLRIRFVKLESQTLGLAPRNLLTRWEMSLIVLFRRKWFLMFLITLAMPRITERTKEIGKGWIHSVGDETAWSFWIESENTFGHRVVSGRWRQFPTTGGQCMQQFIYSLPHGAYSGPLAHNGRHGGSVGRSSHCQVSRCRQ